MNGGKMLGLLVLGTIAAGAFAGPAPANEQWNINHGMNNPAVDPRLQPGGLWSGYVPQIGNGFWAGAAGTAIGNTVPVGTVLTAILETDLSSSKNKQGDTFLMTLQDGFMVNDRYVIPPNSKIIGTVNHVNAAKNQKGGLPGELQISLQSLVFPDGSHLPIYAMIASNPNHTQKNKPKVRNLGTSLSDYGTMAASMGLQFVRGPGFMMNKFNRGNDFELDKGEVLPVRLTRPIQVPQSVAQQAASLASLQPPGTKSSGAMTPQTTRTAAPQAVPGLVDPQGPVYIPPAADNSMPPPAPPLNSQQDTGGFGAPQTSTMGNRPDPF